MLLCKQRISGKQSNIKIATKSTLEALPVQFKLCKSELGRKDCTDFPCLKTEENVTDE